MDCGTIAHWARRHWATLSVDEGSLTKHGWQGLTAMMVRLLMAQTAVSGRRSLHSRQRDHSRLLKEMFATSGLRDLEIVRAGLPSQQFPTLSTRFFQSGVVAVSEKME